MSNDRLRHPLNVAINVDEYIRLMGNMQKKPDILLCELIEELGYPEIVKAYKNVLQ